MNLPEYRSAVSAAHSRFRRVVESAAEDLTTALAKIDAQFFEEQPKAMASEDEAAAIARLKQRDGMRSPPE